MPPPALRQGRYDQLDGDRSRAAGGEGRCGQLAHSAYVLPCAPARMGFMEALADGAPTALAAGAALVAMAAVLSWVP